MDDKIGTKIKTMAWYGDKVAKVIISFFAVMTAIVHNVHGKLMSELYFNIFSADGRFSEAPFIGKMIKSYNRCFVVRSGGTEDIKCLLILTCMALLYIIIESFLFKLIYGYGYLIEQNTKLNLEEKEGN